MALTFHRISDDVNYHYYSDNAKLKIDKTVAAGNHSHLFFVCTRVATFGNLKMKTHN